MAFKHLLNIIPLILTLLFIYTGLVKIIDHSMFESELAQPPLLKPFSRMATLLLPGLELVTALCLMIRRSRLIPLHSAFTLMLIFTDICF